MDFIRPIAADRDVDPLRRVERARDERERREREQAERREQPPHENERPAAAAGDPAPGGPTEGDDGRLHIDTTV
jgi:hypothetical protein